MKEAILSASLVCKQWHRLVHESVSLWSIFFHRDIVELPNPLPFWLPETEESESDDGKSWKEECMEAFAHTREPKKGWEWALVHGYLGLARIMLPRLPGVSPEWERISCLLSQVNSDESHRKIINSIRCLVALGYSPRTADPSAPAWRSGGFLHMATSCVDSVLLQFLVTEYCPEGVDEKLRLDINEQSALDQFTPLHCLFEDTHNYVKTDESLRGSLMLLLQYGANPSLRNNSGKDCMEFACNQGFGESARVMQAFKNEK